MQFIIICLVAFFASGLTLFSGFGLGTLLVPVFAIFFPINLAVALTAIVHLLNNTFKFLLFRKNINKDIIIKFGVPAIIASFIGAGLLVILSELKPIMQYTLLGKTYSIIPIKLVLAILIIFFALFDIIPKLSKITFDKKYLPLGGFLSGFFGGLSGNQGALRSAFLIKSNLSKEGFIATGVSIALLIDISRITVYAKSFLNINNINIWLLLATTLSAFVGTYIGNKLVKKITIKTLQIIVGVMLFLIAVGLGVGIV